MAREDTIKGLREMADFLEAHPAVPVPWFFEHAFVETKAEIVRIAREGGGWDKAHAGGYFSLRKEFSGGVVFSVSVAREQVCERVVVGHHIVPAVNLPERVEEDVEWVCDKALLDE